MRRRTALDGWLDELIMCGWPWPVTRRQAVDEMVADGFTHDDAIKALCWYSTAEPATQS